MRLLVSGHGRMGRAVAEAAASSGHEITGFVSRTGEGDWPSVAEALGAKPADAVIDFTRADGVDCAVAGCLDGGLPLVTGTTGWGDRMEEITGRVRDAGGTILHASNFSVGVQLYLRTIRHATALFAKAGHHDVAVEERHHRGKADAPSGTALSIARAILDAHPGKRNIASGGLEGAIRADQLHVSSLRVGHEFGRHAVVFDGEDDVVEIVHSARGRRGFAAGAVRAAEWVMGRRGVFTIDDMLDELLGG